MLRIGVVSDTHKDLSLAKIAIKDMGKVDLLLHAGDHYKDALILAQEFKVETKAVIGNCDYALSNPAEDIFELAGYKFLLTHGHQYGVKTKLDRLYYKGLELGVDIVVFGHTHVPLNVVEGNIQLLNPGSLSLPRGNSKPSYAIIECYPELKIEIEIKEIVK